MPILHRISANNRTCGSDAMCCLMAFLADLNWRQHYCSILPKISLQFLF